MTFLEMEQTTWYEAYKERVEREEQGMKSDFQFVLNLLKSIAAPIRRSINSKSNSRQHQPPHSSLSMGGSMS